MCFTTTCADSKELFVGWIKWDQICWIKWDQISLPKDRGGLGGKNLELFNLALLSKWKWRFLTDMVMLCGLIYYVSDMVTSLLFF
jgi:hypothetical protein